MRELEKKRLTGRGWLVVMCHFSRVNNSAARVMAAVDCINGALVRRDDAEGIRDEYDGVQRMFNRGCPLTSGPA